ncbi:hypothetical protein HF998_01940 [Cellulomonas hominis]|uniref:Uncharacterized protein n=1 Tax=Cellulomonas hominis TaxID=156981 RepID=A0A7W8WB94_9CELL|nr:hypothetical protein [Cellulomonas hominis]MBB5474681.1 hypothetical protein [Cellulomonas hominis]NKY05747.1 hypothetical protein [Cellulomonas hominis]
MNTTRALIADLLALLFASLAARHGHPLTQSEAALAARAIITTASAVLRHLARRRTSASRQSQPSEPEASRQRR